MKTLAIELPQVRACAVTQCAYNRQDSCHARAITVGDSVTPDCDTFFPAGPPVTDTSILGGVGACKVTRCKFNRDLECTAEDIQVGYAGSNARCLTFDPARRTANAAALPCPAGE
jgi:hypothetical protein